MLSYAAAMGLEFDWSVLITATEMEEESLAESLERLVQRGILKELNWGDSYAFLRIVTLAQIYSGMASSLLRVIHRRIAEAYEKLHPDPTPDIIPVLGRHFHLGGVHDKSILYNRYAATQAIGAFSPNTAIHYLERVRVDLVALPGDHRLEEVDVLKSIGEQYGEIGDEARADELYGESLEKLPKEDVTLRALLLLSRAHSVAEDEKLGLAREYCEEAIRLLEKVGHKKGLAIAHYNLGQAAIEEDQLEVAKVELETALGLFDPEKDAKDVARSYLLLGNLYSRVDDAVEQARAIDYYRKAVQGLEPLQDYKGLARIHTNVAITIRRSHPSEALKELMEARDCCEKASDKRFLGWVFSNSVELRLILGQETEAAHDNAEARRIFSRFNDSLGLQQVALNDGLVAQHRKAYEDSEREYLDSLKRAEALHFPGMMVEVLLHLAMMYVEWGRNDDAIRRVSHIREIGEDKVDPSDKSSYEDLKKRLGI